MGRASPLRRANCQWLGSPRRQSGSHSASVGVQRNRGGSSSGRWRRRCGHTAAKAARLRIQSLLELWGGYA